MNAERWTDLSQLYAEFEKRLKTTVCRPPCFVEFQP
jgi:hypothetical protein